MTKHDIHRRFLDQLGKELADITAAARASFATATSDQHRAESKYDTFSLEASFLARGQAQRVAELSAALETLRALPMQKLPKGASVQPGALVRLTTGQGATRTLLFASAAGGETILVKKEEITIVTSGSPLGQAVSGRKAGETFEFQIGSTRQTFTVLQVT